MMIGEAERMIQLTGITLTEAGWTHIDGTLCAGSLEILYHEVVRISLARRGTRIPGVRYCACQGDAARAEARQLSDEERARADDDPIAAHRWRFVVRTIRRNAAA